MPSQPQRKPRDEEIDVHGLTHVGRRRTENEDHFLICALRKQVVVLQSSLPGAAELGTRTDRVAMVAMVADGVSGAVAGDEASRVTVEAATAYVSHSMECYYRAGSAAGAAEGYDDEAFATALQEAAMQCHERLLAGVAADSTLRGMATTLTLWLGVWPRAYLLQVGDSRCYRLRGGVLMQLSRDQTMAQELVEAGVYPRVESAPTKLVHTLSSSLGGPQTAPRVTRLTQEWGDVGLLCSDGLTRHVPDERIRERLTTCGSAREMCETLLKDALDAGGHDNITIVVGRTYGPPPE